MSELEVAAPGNPGATGGEERQPSPGAATHWYYITTYWCVLCGRTEEYRTRMFTPRPDAWEDRHEEYETACSGHFI